LGVSLGGLGGKTPIEATQAIDDADPRAKDESFALIEHGVGEAEWCYRVLRWMLDEHPYLAC
jgi:hypothetical protein